MCFVWLSEQTVTFGLYIVKSLVFVTVAESVYSAVRTGSLFKTDTLRPSRVNTDVAGHLFYIYCVRKSVINNEQL